MIELADTSAWSWSRRRAYPELRHGFDEALIDDELATCDTVRLELLHSARNATEFAEIREELAALPDCPIDNEQWSRALSVYEQLSAQGGASQRSVKHPDLLIAAAAEAADMGVLHSGACGPGCRWVRRNTVYLGCEDGDVRLAVRADVRV